jgi:hypothetical protein
MARAEGRVSAINVYSMGCWHQHPFRAVLGRRGRKETQTWIEFISARVEAFKAWQPSGECRRLDNGRQVHETTHAVRPCHLNRTRLESVFSVLAYHQFRYILTMIISNVFSSSSSLHSCGSTCVRMYLASDDWKHSSLFDSALVLIATVVRVGQDGVKVLEFGRVGQLHGILVRPKREYQLLGARLVLVDV